MSKRFIVLIAVGFIVLNIVLLLYFRNVINVYKENQTVFQKAYYSLQVKEAFYKSLYELTFVVDSCNLNLQQKVRSTKGESKLEDIIVKGRRYLVFCYSSQDCAACIDLVFQKLNTNSDMGHFDKIILTQIDGKKEIVTEQSLARVIPVFSLSESLFKNDLEISSPILFFVDENQKVLSILTIDSSGEFLEQYFQLINNR